MTICVCSWIYLLCWKSTGTHIVKDILGQWCGQMFLDVPNPVYRHMDSNTRGTAVCHPLWTEPRNNILASLPATQDSKVPQQRVQLYADILWHAGAATKRPILRKQSSSCFLLPLNYVKVLQTKWRKSWLLLLIAFLLHNFNKPQQVSDKNDARRHIIREISDFFVHQYSGKGKDNWSWGWAVIT